MDLTQNCGIQQPHDTIAGLYIYGILENPSLSDAHNRTLIHTHTPTIKLPGDNFTFYSTSIAIFYFFFNEVYIRRCGTTQYTHAHTKLEPRDTRRLNFVFNLDRVQNLRIYYFCKKKKIFFLSCFLHDTTRLHKMCLIRFSIENPYFNRRVGRYTTKKVRNTGFNKNVRFLFAINVIITN